MSTVAPKPPASARPPLTPAIVDSEGYIDDHIRRTRRALKLVDFSAGLLSLAVAMLAFLLVAAVLDQWVVPGGLSPMGRAGLLGGLVVVVSWHAWRHFVPLLRSINPVYAAHTIERTTPSLKNSLLNLLLFRTHRQQMSAKVYHALEQQAAQRLSISTADATVDHSALLRLGYALLAVVAVCAIYSVLSPKNLVVSAARVLAPWSELAAPTRVQIIGIQPGDTAVARGERLTVTAEVHGARRDEPVRLRYSTADEQTVDESIAMIRPADGVRFEGQLPRAADAGATSGVMQQLEYWLEAGDAQSRHYKVAVFDRPTLVVERVRYEFPAYTGIPSAEVAGTGDLRGLEGTRVTLRAIASQPIKSAAIDFDGDGTSDLKMNVEGDQADRAVASFVLALRDDRRTPAHPTYVLRLETTAGRKNADPAQYRIEVTPDYAPEVRVTRPEEAELAVRVDQVVPIGVEARDPDFAVAQVRLIGRVGDRDVAIGDLLDKNHEGRVAAGKLFTPADAQLKAGDVLEYWAEARDNRRPEPNIGLSEHRRLKIVGAPDGPNKQQPGQPGQQGQQQGDDQSAGGQAQDGQQGGQQQGGGQQEGGQQDGAEGQPGQQGTSGASGQSEGEKNDQAAGEQSAPGGAGEGQSKDDQQAAAGGSGAGQAGQDQKPADAASAPGEQSQPGQEGQQPPTSQQQSGEQQPGGQPGSGDQQSGVQSQPSKVSPEGDDDGSAFERMKDHFAQEDANNPNNKAGNAIPGADQKTNQSDGAQQSGDPSKQTGDKQQPKANQQPADAAKAEGKAGAQPKQSAGQSGDPQPSGEGQTQPQAGAQDLNQRRSPDQAQQRKTGDGNPGQPQEGEKPSPDSVANQNQGNAGSGRATKEDQGAPGLDESAKKASDKTDSDNGKAKGDKEPPSGSPDKRESNSRGSTGGDASGGGQEGGGQKADAEGKGDAGQHEAADQGAGKADEQGEGATGDNAGDQQQAEGQTGNSSGDKPGQGSQGREGQQSAADGQQQDATGEKTGDQQGRQPKGPKPGESGEQSAGKSDQQDGKQSGDQGQQSGDQGQQPGSPSDTPSSSGAESASSDESSQNQSSAQSNPSSGNTSGQPQAGGSHHGESSGPLQPSNPEVADKANLDYARQQTDLVLERLDQQLAKKKVDPSLLKSLGWNEDELRRFVQRWQGLKSRAADNDPDALQKLDAALRSLGLRSDGPLRFRAGATADQVRDLNEAYRARAPLEYSERVRAYVKGAAGGKD